MNAIALSHARLVIVCGLPGAGKTTHARQMEEQGAIRFCADEWMDALSIDHYDEDRRHKIEALQWQRAKQLLEHGLTVIVEWGTWSRAERNDLRLQAQKLGAAVELHYLTAPFDVLFHRVQRRRREHPPITQERLTEWSRKFQAPDSREMALYDKAIVIPADEPTREKVAIPMRHIAGEGRLA
jgi:predicted kinase